MIEYNKARKILTLLWLIFAALVCTVLLIQTQTGKFEDKVNEAWGWFCQVILPTLSLIITAYFAEGPASNDKSRVEKFRFQLAFGLSFFYLAVVSSTLLFAPSTTALISWLHQSNIYLGPIQGIAAAALGMFFIKKEKTEE
jgi:hypothetical protein